MINGKVGASFWVGAIRARVPHLGLGRPLSIVFICLSSPAFMYIRRAIQGFVATNVASEPGLKQQYNGWNVRKYLIATSGLCELISPGHGKHDGKAQVRPCLMLTEINQVVQRRCSAPGRRKALHTGAGRTWHWAGKRVVVLT